MSAEVVLISDPAVVAIPVVECGEPLANVRGCPGVQLDTRRSETDGSYALLRTGVLERLARAQQALPGGLHLLVVEGYRPPELQSVYFTEYSDQLRAQHPDWPPAVVTRMASRYIAPPDAAPHTAGAAVDLTLCGADGVEVDMGTAVNATPEDSDGACYFAAPRVDGPARANRDLLGRALGGAGLVNYPTEWWHWSYGDRYWAHVTGARHARYAVLGSGSSPEAGIDSRTVER
ncbi:MAG: M15 family metallopeptidase [Pseudonocardiales bacterium]